MPKTDPRVDQYIAKSADFAKPILLHLRKIVHAACPDVEETMKWSFPHFDYRGEMMCAMAAFKEHCSFGFWKASLVLDETTDDAMGHFGKIRSVKDLPSARELTKYIKKAAKLNDEGIKVGTQARGAKEGAARAADICRCSEEITGGAQDLRRLQSEPPPRLSRMDHRSQDRRHTAESAWRPQSNGSPKARPGIGSTSGSE